MKMLFFTIISVALVTAQDSQNGTSKAYLNAPNETPRGLCSTNRAYVRFGEQNITGKVLCAWDLNVDRRYDLLPGEVHKMWGRENDKAFREAAQDTRCPDPRIEISLKDYLTFSENDTVTFTGQFKIPLIVDTDLTIFTIEDGTAGNQPQTLTFDGETRDLRWTRNATGGGARKNLIRSALKDRWLNLTVVVSPSDPDTPIFVQINKKTLIPD
jgi:hypothetical protein